MKHGVRLTAFGAAAFLSVAAASPASSSTPSPAPDDGEIKVIDGVRTNAPVDTGAQLEDFIESSTPKTITQEVASGDLTTVMRVAKTNGINRISMRSPCGSRDLCVQANPPYSHNGFYGSGTKTGSWPGKVLWTTGKWTGKVRAGSGSYTNDWVG